MIATNLDFDEFLALLLIYASHADLDFSESEKEMIINRVSQEVFEEVYELFNGLTDYQALNLILSYKEIYFATEKEKNNLVKELTEIFNADGEFSPLEKELLQFLDRLM